MSVTTQGEWTYDGSPIFMEEDEKAARKMFENLKADLRVQEMWLVKSWNEFTQGWWIEFAKPKEEESQVCDHFKAGWNILAERRPFAKRDEVMILIVSLRTELIPKICNYHSQTADPAKQWFDPVRKEWISNDMVIAWMYLPPLPDYWVSRLKT